ncbi:ABC transporter permease [Lachnospiraceae bacterium]|nr:ABC transporter permease [Lachnospiraceae bacterium]
MVKLAMANFGRSFKNYLAIILSLAFTILVFLNFQNILSSDLFDVLGKQNRDYIDILVHTVSVALGCFMFFFLWYATNVFLTKQKKEIGIYVFMGLSNQKIGKLYMIETSFIGLSALALGTGLGILATYLFQMILLAISEISVDISFRISSKPILVTAAVYLIMYIIFAIKGYVNIVRSSVLEMVSASRANEYVRQNPVMLFLKTVAGIVILFLGYYLAVKEGGQEVMGNVFAAVVLVIAGVYLLFGGFLPMLLQSLAKKKLFLYKKQRNLWINNVIFRMKKNYRTYAMTCVLMLCSVTALATGFAMKYRYNSIVHFRNTYTYQFLSARQDLDEVIRPLIEKDNQISYSAELPFLAIDASLFDTPFTSRNYAILPYSGVKRLAEQTGLEFEMEPLGDDEIIEASHLYLLSLLTARSNQTETLNGKTYREVMETNVPYLGCLQEMMSFYVVNDAEYERLLPLGEQMYTYNYRIEDIYNFAASIDELDTLNGEGADNAARVVVDPNSSDIEWIKVLYTVCIFMFMVFVLASGSVLFMKLYNDAFEEKERYLVLKKLGVAQWTLKKSLSHELKAAYGLPFAVMAVSAYFAVHALEKMMYTNLMAVYAASVGVIFVFFLLCYWFSVEVYAKNAGV